MGYPSLIVIVLESTFFKQFLDALFGYGELAYVLPHPCGKVALDLVAPACVDLAGGIGAFTEPLLPKHVAQAYDLGSFHHKLREMRGNENHTAVTREHHIARHDRGCADTRGCVDA